MKDDPETARLRAIERDVIIEVGRIMRTWADDPANERPEGDDSEWMQRRQAALNEAHRRARS